MEKVGIFSANNPNRTGNMCAGVGLTLSVALGVALVILARKFPQYLPSRWTKRSGYLVPPVALTLVGLRGAVLCHSVPKQPPSDEGLAIQERLALLGVSVGLSQDACDYELAIKAVKGRLDALSKARYNCTRQASDWQSDEILRNWWREMQLAECAVDLLFEKLKLGVHITLGGYTMEEKICSIIFQFSRFDEFADLKADREPFLIIERMCKIYDEGRRLYLHQNDGSSGHIEAGRITAIVIYSSSDRNSSNKCSTPFFTEGTIQNCARASYNRLCKRMKPYLVAALEAEGLERRSVKSPWLQRDNDKESSRIFIYSSRGEPQFQKKKA